MNTVRTLQNTFPDAGAANVMRRFVVSIAVIARSDVVARVTAVAGSYSAGAEQIRRLPYLEVERSESVVRGGVVGPPYLSPVEATMSLHPVGRVPRMATRTA